MLDIIHQVCSEADLRLQKVLLTLKRQSPLWEAWEPPNNRPAFSSPSHSSESGDICLTTQAEVIHEQQPADCVMSHISGDRMPSPLLRVQHRKLSWWKWVPSHLVLLRKNYQITEAYIYKFRGSIHSPL